MSFTARDITLQELWGRSENRFEVPRYQREYSWGSEEIETLWIDLHQDDDFFFGSVVMKEGDQQSRIEIIDGQQRLLTITILYAAIRDVTDRIGDGESAARIHSNRIYEAEDFGIGGQYIINPAPSLRNYFRRSIQKYPNPDFSRPITKEEKLVRGNYNYFNKSIKAMIEGYESSEEKIDALVGVMNKIKTIKIIWIKVSDEYDAYRIFETVNARGVDLSVADLLKNMIFKEINVDDSGRDPAREKWDLIKSNLLAVSFDIAKFVRYQWISSRQTVTMGKLYRAVKENTTSRGWVDLLNSLVSDSNLLRELIAGDVPNPNGRSNVDEINFALASINDMGFSQCYVLMLSLFRNRERCEISWDELNRIVKEIEQFNFIYHTICSLPANKVEKFYSETAIKIESIGEGEDAQARLRSNLNSIYAKFNELRPTKDQFTKKFLELKYVNSTKRKRFIRYLLNTIDSYHHPRQQSEVIVVESISIEHILPQKPTNWGLDEDDVMEYVNRIGNLVLVGQPLNSEAQNFSLKRKVAIFSESSIRSTVELMREIEDDLDMNWNEETIHERAIKLAGIAYDEIWNSRS